MSDLKIPNLNKNSDKYLFKKKLSLRRKSKRRLINEFFLMLSFGSFLIYLIFIIPNKIEVFNNFSNNLGKLLSNILISMSFLYEICLAIFIVILLIFSLIFILGCFSRLIKILKRKSRNKTFK